jgi:hypothetical protein
MGEKPLSEAEVLRQIENVRKYVSDNKNTIPERIYTAMDAISRTALAYLDEKKPGWASTVKGSDNQPIWTSEQATLIEEATPLAVKQAGGADKLNPVEIKAGSEMIIPAGNMPPISLDLMAEQIKSYLTTLDQKNRELARTVGPVAFIHQMSTDPGIGPILPYMPFRLQFPARLILPTINAILESARLIVSNSSSDNANLRKIYSFILGMFDIFRGEWKDGILSFLGLISYDWMIYGMVGKVARWVYNFISPDIKARIEEDMYASTKSMIIGGWLWLLSVASPDFVRARIMELIDKAKLPIEELNKKIEGIGKEAQAVAKNMDISVQFPKIPLDKIPSFDDIQNFQSLLGNPQVYCSQAFQESLVDALKIPAFRIVIELMNIPTTPTMIAEKCKDIPANIGDAVAESMKPIVTPK